MKTLSRIIVFIIVGIVLIATFKFLWDSSRPEISTYEIVSPVLGDIDNVTTVTGNIEPRNETSVKPEIPGIISKIYKEIGDYVNEGEIIATLRIIPDAAQLNAAESLLRITDIVLEQITSQYKRQKELFENEIISKNEYEVIEAEYQKAIEEKENAEIALEIAQKGFSRRANLVDNTQIRSRSSGTILDIPVKIGRSVIQSNPFHEGTTIAQVANMKDLIFRGTIDESEVGKIWEGMPVNISIGAIPNETIDARLEYIAPQGTKESGSVLYEIKAALIMPETSLIRINYSANANIIIAQVKDVIKIPESAVEFSKSGMAYVYILKSQTTKQTFTKRAIEIGLYDGDYVEVKMGLTLNDQIRGTKIETQSK